MSESVLHKLHIPIESPSQLKEAFRLIRTLREDPVELMDWVPETEQPVLVRLRHEVALSLVLVQSLKTGAGEPESRVRAAQRLYVRNAQVSAEAVTAGALLLRSRMVTGATDVETFWLAVSFAYSLYAMADRELRAVAWRYLCHAPFALDPFTSLAFATVSRKLQRTRFPLWPLELIDWHLSKAAQADMGRGLLEAVVCAELQVHDMYRAGEKLRSGKFKRSEPLEQALERLANHYVHIHSVQLYAREVIYAAARQTDDAVSLYLYLHDQIFELPHDELYALVTRYEQRPEALDAVYRTFVEHDRLVMARRLVECELVHRLVPWKMGRIQPHVQRAIQRAMLGADVSDPRVRELAIRLAILHSRTHHYTAQGKALALRIAETPEYQIPGSTLGAVQWELKQYLRQADPRYLVQREQELLAERWEELSGAERRVMGDAEAWMERRFHLSEHQDTGDLTALRAALSDTHPGSTRVGEMDQVINGALRYIYQYLYRGPSKVALRGEIEEVISAPYSEIGDADIATLHALAQRFAADDRMLGSAVGAMAGLMGGGSGYVADVVGTLIVSARAAARIGACFGIDPGTRAGFDFVINALLMSVASEEGEGLVAQLFDQRPHAYRAITVGGIHYAATTTRRALISGRREGIGGQLASRIQHAAHLLGLKLQRRAWARIIPVLGAVMAAGANYLFLRELTEAAIHLAARRFVLDKHGLGQENEEDGLVAAEEEALVVAEEAL